MDSIVGTEIAEKYRDLRLQIAGLVPLGQELHRNMLFDKLYASIPKDSEINVQVYTAEIIPSGYTPPHMHNGATFFLALQGEFVAIFEDGSTINARAGDVYSEPIAKIHRGHNPLPDLSYLCVGFALTSPDRGHVTNVAAMLNDPVKQA